jgi:hypothetical protein
MYFVSQQACTGIEDVGEAIFHLEESNWDLLVSYLGKLKKPVSAPFHFHFFSHGHLNIYFLITPLACYL